MRDYLFARAVREELLFLFAARAGTMSDYSQIFDVRACQIVK
jgi:hypothetical protein